MNSNQAAAFPNEDAFYCRFFTEVSSLRDAAQRPLHEVDFRAEEKSGAYQRCPFYDSRRGFLMNKAALTQITSEWDGVLEGVRFYTSLFSPSSSTELTLARAWRISLASMFAPLYLLHRKHQPYRDGTLPTVVSGVFKILLDVPTTLDLMMLTRANENFALSSDPSLSAEIQSFADESLILRNGDYACAGSPGLIDQILEILFQSLETRTSDASEFVKLFPDHYEFLEFCYLMSQQYSLGLLYQLTLMKVSESSVPNSNEEKLSAYERRRRIALQVMLSKDRGSAALQTLVEILKTPGEWKLSSRNTIDTKEALQSCLECQSAAEFKKADASIREAIRQVQQEIVAKLEMKNLFPTKLSFGKSDGNLPYFSPSSSFSE